MNEKFPVEAYVEKIGKDEWTVQSGILVKLLYKKKLRIKFEELVNYKDEEYANNCFEWNKKFVKKYKNGNKVLNVKKLLKKIKQKYLIISKEYQKNLHLEQFICIYDYLAIEKNFETKIDFEEFGNEWKVIRKIDKNNVDKNNIKNMFITLNDMIEFKNEKYANDCFEKNKKIFEKDENYNKVLNVEKFFKKLYTKNMSHILSEEYLNNGKYRISSKIVSSPK